MRADRLISIMLMLQSRGKMTAAELAGELEVSERTIYRDIQALSASGVPLYAEHGPGGGLDLLDSYRTDLTGLNEAELRALFLLFGAPGPLERLGFSQDLKGALLKLTAELPESRLAREMEVQQRFYLDWSWWNHTQEPVPHLAAVQQAVWESRRLRIRYRTYMRIPTQVDVEPYGLVAKAGIWYLVARVESALRVYQISWLSEADVLGPFERQEGFQLAEFWQNWCKQHEEQQRGYPVRLRISPELYRLLPLYFGQRVGQLVSEASPADEQGWVTLTLAFESLEAARDRILDLGGAAEVLEPEALRMSLLDYAAQIVKRYLKNGNSLPG
jgi:predicted DNA-binding transcriptional regulator YafY